MRVYRYLCEEELKSILDGTMYRVGTSKINNASNTHHYKAGVKYLHFFKNIDDLQDIRAIKKYNENVFYVGLFDIPLTTLLPNSGKGYYEGHGYDFDHKVVREYAVPADKIKPEHLVFYMEDKSRDVTSEEVKESEAKCKQALVGLKPAKPYEIKRENTILYTSIESMKSITQSGIINLDSPTKSANYIEEKVQ